MTRGLAVSSHSKTTLHLLLNSISRVPSPSTFRKQLFRLNHLLRFSLSGSSSCRRFLCSCSDLQDDPIDMSVYKEAFARRMSMAGLKPHHRIALGVSGGPDSMALCILAANWKTNGSHTFGDVGTGFIDGLLAITVDHGLRTESKEEVYTVSRRVQNIGIRCEIVHCEWPDGRPKIGHLQEAARDRRYQIFHNICIQHQTGVLLIAQHGDDQAELFILRLSRSSGVLGLAGMPFTSQLYSADLKFYGEATNDHGILLVRPLLEFSKKDMYEICQGVNQEWVEDPTNQSPMFARNRIRIALTRLSSSIFSSDIQAVIAACRRTRTYVDWICYNLIDQSVSIMPQGYAVIDIEALNPSIIEDLCLSKFIASVLQFISQRHRPVRGSALKLLLDYFRSFPCKASFTAAGCYLCPAPGSKGTKILVCCTVESPLLLKAEVFQKLFCGQKHLLTFDIQKIIAEGKSYVNHVIPDAASNVQFFNVKSSESFLVEARRFNILRDSTYKNIISLEKDEKEHFRSITEEGSDYKSENEVKSAGTSLSKTLQPGQIGYFMNRFVVKWEQIDKIDLDKCSNSGESCIVGFEKVVKVRHMVDADWLYLAKLSGGHHLENSEVQSGLSYGKMKQVMDKRSICSAYAQISAQKALLLLKSIPVAARRSLPVLDNFQGELISIPSVGFKWCPCLTISADFRPRVPLGGGHSSFI